MKFFSDMIINFFIRMVIGVAMIFLINQFLAEKMMWCMDNPGKIKEIESNAYDYAYGNHRMVRNIESVENIYRSL